MFKKPNVAKFSYFFDHTSYVLQSRLDLYWILAGSQVPFILRPVGNNKYKLIGEVYVHGTLHGEGMEGVDIEYLGIRRILLV